MKKKIALVLGGCGFLDGSEIRESVATLWALSTIGAEAHCFSPDKIQVDVIDALKNEPMMGVTPRNLLTEASRIARGKIRALEEIHANKFDGIIFPGGFGVAKNFCTFATQGANGTVAEDIAHVLDSFKIASKPIGAICISPALVAMTFKNKNFELTIGPASDASKAIESLGHRHFPTKANECHIDQKNKIVSTPAYMIENAPLHEIFDGIRKTVSAVVEMG